jgi:TonB-dependent SusC/RagA subfamily outer membrane receptor
VERTRISVAAAMLCAVTVTTTACRHGAPAEDTSPRDTPAPRDRSVVEPDATADANASIEDLIRGRFSNVTIYRTGGGMRVLIRGVSTFSGGTDALVVIDGVAQDSPDALLHVNPRDVTRIEVLKDAAAARFGMRGQNGVLVITTKRSR